MLVFCFLAFYDTDIFEAGTPRFLNISPSLTFLVSMVKKKKNPSYLDFQSLYTLPLFEVKLSKKSFPSLSCFSGLRPFVSFPLTPRILLSLRSPKAFFTCQVQRTLFQLSLCGSCHSHPLSPPSALKSWHNSLVLILSECWYSSRMSLTVSFPPWL